MDSTPHVDRPMNARIDWTIATKLVGFHSYARSMAERCNEDGDYAERARWTKCVHAAEHLMDALISVGFDPFEPQNQPQEPR